MSLTNNDIFDLSKHLVLDIETFGVNKGAAIASIGAVCGDASFYVVVAPFCGECEEDTEAWWESNAVSDEARAEIFKTPLRQCRCTEDALRDFLAFIEMAKPNYFWGNSPDFDFGHVEYWLRAFNLDVPWDYWQLRDIRTIKDFVDKEVREEIKAKYTPHIAIEDAKAERDILQAFLISADPAGKGRDWSYWHK